MLIHIGRNNPFRPIPHPLSMFQAKRSCKALFSLKVPKCEIFHRSDFDDFYTIKSLCEGDFGVKIKNFIKIFRGSFRGAKFLMRMLSLFFRSFFLKFGPKKIFPVELLRPLVTVNNNFLKFFIFEVLKKLLKNFTFLCICSGLYAYAEHTHQELARTLSVRVRN
jgi:hypothetical protein